MLPQITFKKKEPTWRVKAAAYWIDLVWWIGRLAVKWGTSRHGLNHLKQTSMTSSETFFSLDGKKPYLNSFLYFFCWEKYNFLVWYPHLQIGACKWQLNLWRPICYCMVRHNEYFVCLGQTKQQMKHDIHKSINKGQLWAQGRGEAGNQWDVHSCQLHAITDHNSKQQTIHKHINGINELGQ